MIAGRVCVLIVSFHPASVTTPARRLGSSDAALESTIAYLPFFSISFFSMNAHHSLSDTFPLPFASISANTARIPGSSSG